MLTRDQAREILEILQSLPSDKLAEAYDYLSFLRERYGGTPPIDADSAWNEEDMRDLVAASLAHAEKDV